MPTVLKGLREVPNLRTVRVRKDLTLRGLSARTGVALSTLSQLENRKRKAKPGTVNKLADALGIDNVELLRVSWDQMSEEERMAEFQMSDSAETKLMLFSDDFLHWHALMALAQERKRGLKPASIEELEELERNERERIAREA